MKKKYTAAVLIAAMFAVTQKLPMRFERAHAEGEVLRHLLRQQKQQMESTKETIDLINVKTHDLKKTDRATWPRHLAGAGGRAAATC